MSNSLIHLFAETVSRHAQSPALKHKVQGQYRAMTFQELFDQVEKLAFVLQAMHLPPQSKVAILSENRPEWVIADLAVQTAGHVVVPLYPTLSSEQVQFILEHSDSVIVIVSSRRQLRKVLKAGRHLKGLEHIWILDHLTLKHPSPGGQSDSVHNFSTIMERSAKPGPEFFKSALARLNEGLLASIIYTSGTMGEPKGVMLTHGNFVSNVRDALGRYPFDQLKSALSVLPLSHAFERTCGYYCVLFSGVCIAYSESQASIPQNILEIKPSAMIAVPRLFEKIYSRVLEQAAHSPIKKKIFEWAVGHPQNKLADLLVFSKIRKKTGGNIIFFVSGGAPLNPEISRFFMNAGLPVCEGYGLTEAAPVVASNPFAANKPGTIGTAFASMQVQIAPDQELLVKGPNVMPGYYKNPQATAEAIDAQGWLHTGDLASMDADGYLKIIGRKKEILVLSNGKKVAPVPMEAKLVANPFILQAVIVAEQRKYVSAVVVPHWEKIAALPEFAAYAQNRKALYFREDAPALFQFYDAQIHKQMVSFAGFEQIKHYCLMGHEFTEANGFLTPKLEVKRHKVYEKFSKEINRLYS